MAAKQQKSTALYEYPKYWAECMLPAPFLPMSRAEMDQLGWDSCDVILVTGDAYVDHPAFGTASLPFALSLMLSSQRMRATRIGEICGPEF